MVGFDYDCQVIVDGWGFLEVFYYVVIVVGGGDIGLVFQVVVVDVYFVGCQQVVQVYYVCFGVWGVVVVGEVVGELGEFVEGVVGGVWVVFGYVQWQEVCQQVMVLVEGGQVFEVVGVVDVGVLWMQVDEVFGGGVGGFGFYVFVVGVDQFELGLFGVVVEGIV